MDIYFQYHLLYKGLECRFAVINKLSSRAIDLLAEH